MYIEELPNKSNKPAILLRKSKRENGKVVKTTVANLSRLKPEIIQNLKIALKGGTLSEIPTENTIERIQCKGSVPCGHVNAVLTAIGRLGIQTLLDPNPSKERTLILGLVAAMALNPLTRPAAAVRRKTCVLESELGIGDYDGNIACSALDWLLERQPDIQRRLADRHLNTGD
jgi:hypothetical protein